jgi:MFS family permease
VVSGALLFLKPQFHLSTVQQEWVVSALLVGTIVGAGAAGPAVQRPGRDLSGVCHRLPWLIGGRFWLGLAVGAASMVLS